MTIKEVINLFLDTNTPKQPETETPPCEVVYVDFKNKQVIKRVKQ